MNRLPFADLDVSAAFLEPLFVELSRSHVLPRNKLNGVVRPEHPRQVHSDGLKPLVETDGIFLRIVRRDPVYGQREMYEPAFADRVERTPAHSDVAVAGREPDLRNDISPGAHFMPNRKLSDSRWD